MANALIGYGFSWPLGGRLVHSPEYQLQKHVYGDQASWSVIPFGLGCCVHSCSCFPFTFIFTKFSTVLTHTNCYRSCFTKFKATISTAHSRKSIQKHDCLWLSSLNHVLHTPENHYKSMIMYGCQASVIPLRLGCIGYEFS